MHFTLADLVTDITQNACEAKADMVELEIREGDGEFRFLVKDNGKGTTKEELEYALDPFVTDGIKHPHRKVGLGLPFLSQTAIMSGGGWDVQSEKGKGTTATAWFDTGNVDTPPAGDLPGMFRTILMFNSPADILIRRNLKLKDGTEKNYEVRKSELVEALGGLEDAGSLVLLDKYLRSLEDDE
jgi:hypothetical protein